MRCACAKGLCPDIVGAIRESTALFWQTGKELGLGIGGINCLVLAEAQSLLKRWEGTLGEWQHLVHALRSVTASREAG